MKSSCLYGKCAARSYCIEDWRCTEKCIFSNVFSISTSGFDWILFLHWRFFLHFLACPTKKQVNQRESANNWSVINAVISHCEWFVFFFFLFHFIFPASECKMQLVYYYWAKRVFMLVWCIKCTKKKNNTMKQTNITESCSMA